MAVAYVSVLVLVHVHIMLKHASCKRPVPRRELCFRMSLHSVGAALHVNMNSLVGGCVFVVPRSILGVVYYFICASMWDACRQIMMNDFIL